MRVILVYIYWEELKLRNYQKIYKFIVWVGKFIQIQKPMKAMINLSQHEIDPHFKNEIEIMSIPSLSSSCDNKFDCL